MTNRWLLLNFDTLGTLICQRNYNKWSADYTPLSGAAVRLFRLVPESPANRSSGCLCHSIVSNSQLSLWGWYRRIVYNQCPQFHHICLLGLPILDRYV